MKENKKHLIAVYGSLRPGEYNFISFKTKYGDDIKVVGKKILNGYKLYSLGSYPGIKETNIKKDIIHVTILEVSDEVYKHITAMEEGANYITKEIQDGIKIYVYKGKVNQANLVVNGDWCDYMKNLNKQTSSSTVIDDKDEYEEYLNKHYGYWD